MHDVTLRKNYQKDLKSVEREKEKTQRGTYKLTAFHLSWIWIECLVGNASFEEGPFGMVKKKSVYLL